MAGQHLTVVLEEVESLGEMLSSKELQGPVTEITLLGYQVPSLPCTGTDSETGSFTTLPGITSLHCPNLVSLSLKGVVITAPLEAAPAALPKLRTLRLVDFDFEADMTPDTIQLHLSAFSHVTHLHIERAFREHGMSLVGLLTQLQHQLETLQLRGCVSVCVDDLTCDNQTYSCLQLLDTDLAVGGGDELQQLLQAMPVLTQLRTSSIHLTSLAQSPLPASLTHVTTCFLEVWVQPVENSADDGVHDGDQVQDRTRAEIAVAAENLQSCGGLCLEATDMHTPPCIAFVHGSPSPDVLAAVLSMCAVQGTGLHLSGISLDVQSLSKLQPLIDQYTWLVLGGCVWEGVAASVLQFLPQVETLQVYGPVPWDALVKLVDAASRPLVLKLDDQAMTRQVDVRWQARLAEHLAATSTQHVSVGYAKRRKL